VVTQVQVHGRQDEEATEVLGQVQSQVLGQVQTEANSLEITPAGPGGFKTNCHSY
jgi:hypothetical protein